MKIPKKIGAIQIIGLIGLAIGGISTLITNYAQTEEMKETVREEVEKALAERDKDEEDAE